MKIYTPLFALAVAVGIVGCGGTGNGLLNIPNPRIIPVNAFDGVPSAAFEVGSDTSPAHIAFGTAGDPIITVNGRKDISAGETTFTDLVTVTDQLFEQNKRYTAVGYGVNGSRTIGLFENDKSQTTVSTVGLRVIDGAAQLGNVDIYVTDAASGGTLPGSPTISNVAPGAASAYVELPDSGSAISVRVRVFATGTTTTALADTSFGLSDRERDSIVLYDATSTTGGLVRLQDDL